MGGESEAAWHTLLDDLIKRGLKKPELAIVDGAPGLEKALLALSAPLPIQRCTVQNAARDLPAQLNHHGLSDTGHRQSCHRPRPARPAGGIGRFIGAWSELTPWDNRHLVSDVFIQIFY
jgi:hypothetical protein